MWKVELFGDAFDLDELTLAMSNTEPSVEKTPRGYFLKSAIFEGLTSINEVEAAALELLPVLNGICKLLLGTRNPIEIAGFTKTVPGQPREVYVSIEEKGFSRDSFSTTTLKSDGSVESTHQADPVAPWIGIAVKDESVAKVFRILNVPQVSWSELYKIFEVIEQDVKGSTSIVNLGWASSKSMRRFKHTANSPSATGDLSRHGVDQGMPPAAPLSISEAQALIYSLIHNWLQAKA